MALGASQYRKLVREGKIVPEGRSTKGEAGTQSSRSLLRQGIGFAKAMVSGSASEELKAKRLAVCRSPCPSDLRIVKNGKERCEGCHCPSWKFSELEYKAELAMDTCPMGHWTDL